MSQKEAKTETAFVPHHGMRAAVYHGSERQFAQKSVFISVLKIWLFAPCLSFLIRRCCRPTELQQDGLA
jgi:hypothetical protein